MKLFLVETKEEDKSHLNTALTVCILWLGRKTNNKKKNQQNSPESWGEGEIITEKGI